MWSFYWTVGVWKSTTMNGVSTLGDFSGRPCSCQFSSGHYNSRAVGIRAQTNCNQNIRLAAHSKLSLSSVQVWPFYLPAHFWGPAEGLGNGNVLFTVQLCSLHFQLHSPSPHPFCSFGFSSCEPRNRKGKGWHLLTSCCYLSYSWNLSLFLSLPPVSWVLQTPILPHFPHLLQHS
jgi:hypothetical protein